LRLTRGLHAARLRRTCREHDRLNLPLLQPTGPAVNRAGTRWSRAARSTKASLCAFSFERLRRNLCTYQDAVPSSAVGRFSTVKSVLLLFTGQLPNQLCFALAVRSSISMKNLVEPHWRRPQHVRLFPRIPGQIRLRFACHKTPIDGGNIVFFCNRQNGV